MSQHSVMNSAHHSLFFVSNFRANNALDVCSRVASSGVSVVGDLISIFIIIVIIIAIVIIMHIISSTCRSAQDMDADI